MNIVAHNMSAMNAQGQLKINMRSHQKDMEKLSSGYKINRAGDDAAGLSISEKMRQMVKGLDRASDNVQDGISFVQTADGALAEVNDMSQRINELAIQAANGTLSEGDRQAIDKEVQQLKTEMGRIFETTSFNGKKIWGDKGRVGATTVETVREPVISKVTSAFSTTVTDDNKIYLPSSSPEVVATDTGYLVKWKSFNSDGSIGKEFSTPEITWESLGGIYGSHHFSLQSHLPEGMTPDEEKGIKSLNMEFDFSVNAQASKQEAIAALNGRKLIYSLPNEIKVDDGNSGIRYSATMNYNKFLEFGRSFNGDDDSFIEVSATDNVKKPSKDSPSTVMQFKVAVKNGAETLDIKATSGTYNCSVHNEAGENVWWEKRYSDESKKHRVYPDAAPATSLSNASLTSMYKAIKGGNPNVIDNPGNDVTKFTYNFDIMQGAEDIGNVKMEFEMATSSKRGKDDVTAQSEMETALQNIMAGIKEFDIYALANPRVDSWGTQEDSTQQIDAVYYNPIIVYDPHDVSIQSGAETGNSTILEYPDLNVNALGIEYLRTHPQAMALQAIDDIGKAIAIINKSRALFGAYQNRLESTLNIDENTMENTQAAESLIRDTDMAKAMLDFTKGNIISQASQSMLSQANSSAQDVLSLLQ